MDTNPYAPPASADLPPRQRFPNPHVPADRRRVLGAGITLIVLGGLQLLGGIALAAGGLDVPILIAQQQLAMDELTPELAWRLLNAGPNQPLEQITASYQRLAGHLQKQSFSHLGAKLGEIAERRRQVLDRAYALLQQRAA